MILFSLQGHRVTHFSLSALFYMYILVKKKKKSQGNHMAFSVAIAPAIYL